MERRWQLVAFLVVTLVFPELVVGLSIRNEQSGRCVAALKHRGRYKLELVDCQPGSALQEWGWDPESCSLRSLEAEECLSAVGTYPKHDGVRLRSCHDGEDDREGQAWSCSKKGHLTLRGARLHLSVRHSQEHPTKTNSVYLSKDRGQASQWSTISNSSVCGESNGGGICHRRQHSILQHPTATPSTPPSPHTENKTLLNPMPLGEDPLGPTDQDMSTDLPAQPQGSFAPERETVDFLNLDFGISWKVAMLVLSSLALVLGFVILVLSILQNRKKNVVVLKSYTRTGEVSQPGSPVLDDRAPLTKNPMRPAHSPSLPRGEILVAWKDGSVTPLFDTSNHQEFKKALGPSFLPFLCKAKLR